MASNSRDQVHFEFDAVDNLHLASHYLEIQEYLDNLNQPSKLLFHFARDTVYKIIYAPSIRQIMLYGQPNARHNRACGTARLVAILSAANATSRAVLQGPS